MIYASVFTYCKPRPWHLIIHPQIIKLFCCKYNLHKNSQAVKKRAAHAKNGSMKKVVKSKVAAQKRL